MDLTRRRTVDISNIYIACLLVQLRISPLTVVTRQPSESAEIPEVE